MDHSPTLQFTIQIDNERIGRPVKIGHQIKETQQDAQGRSRDSVGGGRDKQIGHHKLYGLVREMIGQQVGCSPSLAQASTISIGRILLVEAEGACVCVEGKGNV